MEVSHRLVSTPAVHRRQAGAADQPRASVVRVGNCLRETRVRGLSNAPSSWQERGFRTGRQAAGRPQNAVAASGGATRSSMPSVIRPTRVLGTAVLAALPCLAV